MSWTAGDLMQLCRAGVVWEEGLAPAGPNIHANATGYREVAATFEKLIGCRW